MGYPWNYNVETYAFEDAESNGHIADSLLTDNGKYPEMEIGLFLTGSSYNYASEWNIWETPTLKPMFDYAKVLAIIENMVVAFEVTFLAIIQHRL